MDRVFIQYQIIFRGQECLPFKVTPRLYLQLHCHRYSKILSASLLVDIIKCVAPFFTEEMDLAIRYIENLTNVSRFDLLIMCLSSTDRDDLHKIWDEVFCSEATPIEYAEMLDKLRSRYCLNW
ncbi:uncharacterized protein LOC115979433 isoform X5 [Quercus lobata]|uniref:uncharacterized protein LOC115979433 isoform X5 n=1 Tax=Quercus lobata TaxID=97700 RepID=UPI001248A16D|nr:uncharacterized protein LOC115979433 isoform X5 [Quercus lobata]XP_030957336.1 uncharacterized protein LOC115979433 isoform X5 [Quercus lobata]XP_030957337.1 uncharacterized protein LOC115979433 isoform X5 [Quercus lobata]